MPMPLVVVAGGVNLDTTFRVAAIPNIGETVVATGKSRSIGGKALNQALAIRRAGMPVALLGAVGADEAGDAIREFLNSEDISSEYLEVLSNAETGRAFILIDERAENLIVVDLGANLLVSEAHIDELGHAWPYVRAVVANGEAPQPLVLKLFQEASKRNITTVWNPSPLPRDVSSIMRLTNTLIVNTTEASDMTSSTRPADSQIRLLADMGPTEIVITLGAVGSLVFAGGASTRIEAPQVRAVDPTAAGDCFLGYYVAGRCGGNPPADAALAASEAAALCVQTAGASDSIPKRGALNFVRTNAL